MSENCRSSTCKEFCIRTIDMLVIERISDDFAFIGITDGELSLPQRALNMGQPHLQLAALGPRLP
jgi:hypothetical protein